MISSVFWKLSESKIKFNVLKTFQDVVYTNLVKREKNIPVSGGMILLHNHKINPGIFILKHLCSETQWIKDCFAFDTEVYWYFTRGKEFPLVLMVKNNWPVATNSPI
jgi:hypothetical protein